MIRSLLLSLLTPLCCLSQEALSPARIRAAADYSALKAGLGMVVWQNGKEVFNESQNSGSTSSYYELASGTKSFSGIIAAAAVADGFLDFDELASDTLTEWKSDTRKSRITVRMLLNLTSGLHTTDVLAAPTYAEAVAAGTDFDPATHFVYDPVHFQAFGELMRRKLVARGGGSPVDYLKSRVLDRIGVKVGNWRLGSDGNPLMPAGAQLAAVEWIKFGEFLRNEGAWGGTQIIPINLMRELRKPGSLMPAYGLTCWLNMPVDPSQLSAAKVPDALKDGTVFREGPVDIYMAAGMGDQRLYIIPDWGVVVARQAPVFNVSDYSDNTFLGLLLPSTPVSTFTNLSTRSRASAGEEAMVAGFVISGSRSKTVLLRAVGPTLKDFGLSSAILDPQLELVNSANTTLKANDNWGSANEAAQLPGAFSRVGAFALPVGSKDAAMLVTLAPGLYTASVTPATGSAGTALVEVYEMPADFVF
jgi:CubicO group peptidase (beta-lactamase class C family)